MSLMPRTRGVQLSVTFFLFVCLLAISMPSWVLAAKDLSKDDLMRVVDEVETKSIYARGPQWLAVKQRLVAASTLVRQDDQGAVLLLGALRAVGDKHAFAVPADKLHQTVARQSHKPVVRSMSSKEAGIAHSYLYLPSFAATSKDDLIRYAGDLRRELARRVEAKGECGWIVDLRDNEGGNMWAMLAGVAPILSANSVGGFKRSDGRIEQWLISARGVAYGSNLALPLTSNAGTRRDAHVAVLISERTASSGEAIAIAFRGQERSRFFGERTKGLTTSTERVLLADSLNLFFSTASFVDRHGNSYLNGVSPDEDVPTRSAAASDDVMDEAKRWLTLECRSR